MFIPLALILAIAFFAVQLLLCFKGKNKWAKRSILLIGIAGELILWLCFLASPDPMLEPGIAFTAYILAAVGLIWLAAMLLAWVVYGVVKTIQKRRKNFGVYGKNT